MLWQLILADYRERVRRYSFLATLTFVFFFGLLVITGKYGVFVNQCRGELNSAWVGTTMATGAAVMTSIVGFYLVKNCLRRDHLTGVGPILAATTLRNATYFISKYVSNVITLLTMLVILVAAAIMMQLTGTRAGEIQLGELLLPFLIITVPVVVLVSALALLFESVGFLSGGFGNVAYFLTMPIWFAPFGLDAPAMKVIVPSMQAAASATHPNQPEGFATGFVEIARQDMSSLPIFHWDGVDWTIEMILPRLLFVALAAVTLFVAVPCFNRFDSAKKNQALRSLPEKAEESPEPRRPLAIGNAATIQSVAPRFSLVSQLMAEIRVLLRRVTIRWQIVALALVIVQLAVPYEYLRSYVAPAVWIWPLLVWSSMGAREKIHNTEALVFSSAHPLARQLTALWLAGVAITMACSSGMILRAILAGDLHYVAVLLGACLFVPTMAATFGVISGGSQLFEVVYTFLWYIGPLNRFPAVDFLATTDDAIRLGVPLVFLAITAVLMSSAFLVRKRQLGM